MVNKTVWSLTCVCFAMSSLLSIVGIISVIQIYFDVSIYYATLYGSIFSGVLGFSSLFLPVIFSKYEKKKLILTILSLTLVCNIIQVFVTDYFIGLAFRIIPAIMHPIAVSSALTIVGKIDPEYTNRVVLGLSSGSILGLSITSYLGFNHGYASAMLWITLVDIIAIILVYLYVPEFEGNKEPVAMQISHAKSRTFLFSIIYTFCVVVGINITYTFIPKFLSEVTNVNGETLFISLFLMGLASLFGTTYSGHLINRNAKLTVLLYPLAFIIIMFVLGLFIKVPVFILIILIFFGMFDGSSYTIVQYWVTSSIREALEFGNGIFLLMFNVSLFTAGMIGSMIIGVYGITYIFIGSIVMLLLSAPFVILRIKTGPDAT